MSANASLIHYIRILARHGLPPMNEEDVIAFSRRNHVHPEAVRAAEKEGRELRAAGARCTCVQCQPDPLNDRERKRRDYAERRRTELEASGVADASQRERLIDAELDAGAAMQAESVTVTRTIRAPP